jgi:4-hydroxybenzoate polyprenyltransferase
MTDDELVRLLRTVIPPTLSDQPGNDLWPLLAGRITPRPASFWVDLSLATALVLTLFITPEWLALLAYYF